GDPGGMDGLRGVSRIPAIVSALRASGERHRSAPEHRARRPAVHEDLRRRTSCRPGGGAGIARVNLSGVTQRVLGSPTIYKILQRVFGTQQTLDRLRPLVADTAGQRILDVGAGTAIARSLLPGPAGYIWLDVDPIKLRGAPSTASLRAILADATRLP